MTGNRPTRLQEGDQYLVSYVETVGPEEMLHGKPFGGSTGEYWVSPEHLRDAFGATVEHVGSAQLTLPVEGDMPGVDAHGQLDAIATAARYYVQPDTCDGSDCNHDDDVCVHREMRHAIADDAIAAARVPWLEAERERLLKRCGQAGDFELAVAEVLGVSAGASNADLIEGLARLTRERDNWRNRYDAAMSDLRDVRTVLAENGIEHIDGRTPADLVEQALASRLAIPVDAEVAPGVVNHIRPVKVSADRVEVEVSTRVSDGTTRAYVREWGRKGGCREVGLILTDAKRAELVARLSAPVSGSDTTGGGLDCGCGHPETPFGDDTDWMCDHHRAFSSGSAEDTSSATCMAFVPDGPESATPCDRPVTVMPGTGRCDRHQCNGDWACPAELHAAGCFVLPAELLNAPIQIWFCPVVEHRKHSANRPVTVEWRDGVAHCTTPGCDRTSAQTAAIATPVRVYRSETNFATYRTPGPDALFEVYNADKGEWQPTQWESLEALAAKCGPMTEVTGP